MTQVKIIGNEKSTKSIQFLYLLTSDLEIDNIGLQKSAPSDFNFIELICRNYTEDTSESFDLMFAYYDKDNRQEGRLIIGHFNDGTV